MQSNPEFYLMRSQSVINYIPIYVCICIKLVYLIFVDPDFSQVFLRLAATALLGYCGVRAVIEIL